MKIWKKIEKNKYLNLKKKGENFHRHISQWEDKAKDMKKFKQIKAAKTRREYLNKIREKENHVMETLSAVNSTYGKNTDNFKTKLESIRSKIYQKTEVNFIL